MNELTLKSLGFTKEEVLEHVAQKIIEDMSQGDEMGYQSIMTEIGAAITDARQKTIEDAVERIIRDDIEPDLIQQIDSLVFQESKKWGEPDGPERTLREHITHIAEGYFSTAVDHLGRTPEEARRRGDIFRGKTTRIAALVHRHLNVEIEVAMKKALEDVNSAVADGLHVAVKDAITKTLAKLNKK